MSTHDKELMKDAKNSIRRKRNFKVFDMDGNFDYNCYIMHKNFSTVQHAYELFIYKDGSAQLANYLNDEPVFSSW